MIRGIGAVAGVVTIGLAVWTLWHFWHKKKVLNALLVSGWFVAVLAQLVLFFRGPAPTLVGVSLVLIAMLLWALGNWRMNRELRRDMERLEAVLRRLDQERHRKPQRTET